MNLKTLVFKNMEVFELTKIMFERPSEYMNVSAGIKRKHYFIIQRRMAINFPEQAQLLQHLKIDEVGVIDFWQDFLRRQYTKTPYWMYTKGLKKTKELKEKKLSIKESEIKEYAIQYSYDLKSVREAIIFFPDEMKKEFKKFKEFKKEIL